MTAMLTAIHNSPDPYAAAKRAATWAWAMMRHCEAKHPSEPDAAWLQEAARWNDRYFLFTGVALSQRFAA